MEDIRHTDRVTFSLVESSCMDRIGLMKICE